MRVFFDTNILLDVLMESRSAHTDSVTLLQVAQRRLIEAVITTQSLIDTFYVFSQKEKDNPEQFRKALRLILSFATISPINEDDIKDALASGNEDFEDAAQLACASRTDCDVVLTSDKKMRKYSTIPVYTPAELCNLVFNCQPLEGPL